jgi:hypothetical protein
MASTRSVTLSPVSGTISEHGPRLRHKVREVFLHSEVPRKLQTAFCGVKEIQLSFRLHGNLVELKDLHIVR